MKNKVALLCVGLFLLPGIPNLQANNVSPVVEITSAEDDFKVVNFKFEGRDAFLKVPQNPLPGKPWIWRAQFHNYHTEVDDILLKRGYYVAFVNTSNMFGSPKAMAVWDRFYCHMVNHYGLAQRVVLEGVSRGGLYIHNWAKLNPTKVACIYADVPVCDFRTWPKEVNQKEWENLKEMYGFASETEAMNYQDMPIHNLEGMAALKIPVLHSICNLDKIVPPVKNSMVFGLNYLKAGGIYGAVQQDRVYDVKQSKGHHFHLQYADKIAEYIYMNSYPVKNEKYSKDFHHYNDHKFLGSKLKMEKEKKLNIAFFGGSITQNPGWKELVEKYFRTHYPDVEFTFQRSGIASLGSVPHAFRYKRDILDHMVPDILFYEAAVNDNSNGYPKSDQQKAIEGIFRNTKSLNPNADIIMMHFADPDKLEDYKEGKEHPVIVNHNEVAAHYQVPVIDISREIYERIENKEFSWEDDIKDLHPSRFGSEYYAQSIRTMLDTLIANTPVNLPLIKKAKLPKPMYKVCYDKACYESVETATGTFKFHHNYVPQNGQATRPGFTNVPMQVGENVGDKLKFTFNGNAVGICVISGNDAGMIRYRVDKKAYQTIDLFTEWSQALHLPWYLVLDDQLKNGKHTLEIEIISDKNKESKGNACRIVHFLVNH